VTDNQKPEPKSESQLLEEARERTIDNAVKLLTQYSKLKAARPRPPGSGTAAARAREPAERTTDAFYELMQLQFAFGNRVAELQGEYGALAMRTLERWYGALSRDADTAGSVLRFRGTGVVRKQLTVENRLGDPTAAAELTCGPLRGPRPARGIQGAFKIEVDGNVIQPQPKRTKDMEKAKSEEDRRYSFYVVAGMPCVVSIELDLTQCKPGVIYEADATLRMGRQTRTVVLKAIREEA
jgi:hypothetical protein